MLIASSRRPRAFTSGPRDLAWTTGGSCHARKCDRQCTRDPSARWREREH